MGVESSFIAGNGAGVRVVSESSRFCRGRAAVPAARGQRGALRDLRKSGASAYQLDRAAFDEEVLRRACASGAELLRPAQVTKIELTPGGQQTITVRIGEGIKTVQSRWVVDASGVAAVLARKQGWWRSNTEHPTAAAWSRWKGVKDWDSHELATKYPEWASAVYGIRGTATNHVIGDGWWSWWIPLKGGDVSVGVVFDQRLVDWPQEGGTLGERLNSPVSGNS